MKIVDDFDDVKIDFKPKKKVLQKLKTKTQAKKPNDIEMTNVYSTNDPFKQDWSSSSLGNLSFTDDDLESRKKPKNKVKK